MNGILRRNRSVVGLPVGVWILAAATAYGNGLAAQRIVVRKLPELLPAELAPLFSERQADLRERVVEPDTAWPRDKKRKDRNLWHRVAMDVAAETESKDARMAAALRFPREKMAAKRLYGKINKRGGSGLLIWVIEDLFNQLVAAFREGAQEDIIRSSGYLVHFAVDAAFPFGATANHDGKPTENLHLGRVRLGRPQYAHRHVAARFGGELIRRNRGRYAESLDLSAGDYDPVDEPVSRTRSVLLASLAELDAVLQADREVVDWMEVTEGNALLERADEYYQLLDQKCGDICVERLGHGAVFAANLIGGAWTAAGKPSLQEIRGRSDGNAEVEAELTAAVNVPKNPVNSTQGPIIGSRHSNIYHVRGCTFGKQIAPDNLVTFKSVAEAKKDGRRACRVCKPPP
ncbi:MAG: hypothetical protein ACE5GE_08710 [Phycisphaerae bacterium]